MKQNTQFRLSLLSLIFLTACDSGQSGNTAIVQTQSVDASAPSFAFAMPDRIRTSQAVNLDATVATISTSAGDITLDRDGDQFVGSIMVQPGSNFSFTLTIFENVGGQNVVYATSNGISDQPVNTDVGITIPFGEFLFPDDDGDGADNLSEIEAGSDHENSFSTPDNPDGMPPTETTPGLLQFSSSTFTVAEADGELTVPVERTGGSDGRVTVNYAFINETAINNRDFNAATGQLVWEDGDSTPRNINISIQADDVNDGEQTFSINLFNPAGGAGITNGATRVTITDSTPPPQRGTIQLTTNQITVNEDAGTVEISVERTGGNDGPVSVEYSISAGTATEEDFTLSTGTNELTWADGEDGIQTIRIPITNDSEVESAETFTVNLFNNLGGASLGLSEVSVVVTDTTAAPLPGQLSFAGNNRTVAEGSSIDIVVSRSGGSAGTATVEYTVTSGTADADDFTATDGVLTWDDGDSSTRTITIDAVADNLQETEETILVTLQNATGASIDNDSITITINDATVAVPSSIALTASTAAVAEGSSVTVNVSRSGGSNGQVTVDVSAPASAEYTVTPAQLVWTDGDTEDQSITLTAIDDDITGDTETVTILLSNPTGGASISSDSIAVTINDATPEPEPEPGAPFLATDGEWEVCIAPFNTPGPTAFATQLSANEGRIVSCVKTCDIDLIVPDEQFPGWGWNPVDLHSCVTTRDPGGTYTRLPIYTPARETVNLNLSVASLAVEDSIWGCAVESRENAEEDYVADPANTIWYQFMDDGTYMFGSSEDGAQPEELLGPDIWSVNGRVLELGHINTGYRNTLFRGESLHIHPTTDGRLNCTSEARLTSLAVQ